MLEVGAVVVTYVLVALPVRYLASGTWWIRWKPFKNRVQVKRRKFIPRQNCTPFLKIRLWNVANFLYGPSRRTDLTIFFFAWPLVSYKIFSEIWTLLRPKIKNIRRKKDRKPTPEVTSRRRHTLHVCKISLSLKIGVDIQTVVPKTCILRSYL